MKLRVIDFETTGLPEDREKGKQVAICEIGWTDVTDCFSVGLPNSAIVNPGHPIPPEARAVHHLSDDDVANGMDQTTALRTLMDGMEPGDVFVAHNIAMERAFFGGGTHPWICTYKCAQHLFQDAPGHGNQTLRYWLGLDEKFEWPGLAMPAHRAGPDTYVTAYILQWMLRDAPVSRLLELTQTPVLQKYCMLGKNSGKLWSEVDSGFLEWVLDPSRNFSAEITHTARHWLRASRTGASPFGN